MPTFGDYETVGEPIAVSEERGRTTTLWQARKSGGGDPKIYCVKCFLAHPTGEEARPDDKLDADWALEALEAVKQLKKAHTQGGRGLAPVLDFGTSLEGMWYISDYYKRGTLEGLIELRGRVDGPALRHVVHELATGCLALQRTCGRSHGNLKSANVLLSGRPRPLRATPLHLIDPLPISLIRAPHLDPDDQRGMVELMREVSEVQDLSAIGLIILQLVEGRHVRSGYDYNYPIEATTAWQRLGKDADRWRRLCNRLLDPQLSLADTNLAKLAADNEPSALMAKLPLIAGVAGVVLVIGAVILFWPRESVESKFQKALAAARQQFDAANLPEAGRAAEQALKLKPNDDGAKKLSTDIGLQVEKYKKDLDDATAALTGGKLDEADRLADEAARLNKPGTEPAGLKEKIRQKRDLVARQTRLQQLLASAKQGVEERRYGQAAQDYGQAATLAGELGDTAAKQLAETEKTYAAALADADQAETAGQFAVAVSAWQRAVEAKPGDPRATNGLAAAQRKVADLTTQQKYDEAMKAGQDAFNQGNYDGAINLANVALGFRSGDQNANRMKSDAEARKREAAATAAQAARDASYRRAMELGQTALQQKDYDGAITQATVALAARPGDAAAGQLKATAEVRRGEIATQAQNDANYQRAIQSGQAAYQQKDYDGAIKQATVALGLRPGDATASQLKADAEARKAELAAIAASDANYRRAIQSGRAAYQQKDYDTAITQANAALGIRPGDAVAIQLKTDAEARKGELAALAAQDADYQRAFQAGRAAYQQKDYDSAITQADAALVIRPRDAAAGQLKADAEARKREIATQAANDANYQKAIAAGRTAYQQNDYDGAIAQANAALGFHPGDAAAGQLKADAQARKNEIAARKDQDAKYAQAITDGQAALAGKSYDLASTRADDALRIRPGDAIATKLKADAAVGLKAVLQQELAAAKADFDQGDYPGALNICNRRPGEADFANLAASVNAEQQALTAAQNRLKVGDYQVAGDVQALPYGSKKPFTDVVTQATQEKGELDKLVQLERGKWADLNTEFSQFAQREPAAAQKPPFLQVRQWLAANDPVRQLDQNLQLFQVWFKLRKPSQDIKDSSGKVAGPLPRGIDIDAFSRDLQTLKTRYQNLGKLTAQVNKDFKNLQDAILSWND